jgi:hypothetical protein
MRMPGEWEIDEIVERFGAPFSRDGGGAHVSP